MQKMIARSERAGFRARAPRLEGTLIGGAAYRTASYEKLAAARWPHIPHIMRSTTSSIPSLFGCVLVALVAACGGRADAPLDETTVPAPEREPTGDEGLFIPPTIPGVDRIADGLGTPSAIALSENDIAFTTRATMVGGELVAAGGLYVKNKKVGVPLLLLLDGRGAAYESVVVDGGEAFIGTSDGRVLTLPLRGGQETAIVEAESPVSALTVTGTFVYYATNQNEVLRVLRTGGKSEPIGKVSSPVRGIEVDDEKVYVATTDAIVRFTKTEGHVVEGASGSPCAMIRDGRKLFWTNQATDRPSVLRLALDVGDVQAVVAGGSPACAIASDAASVVFATDSGLMRVPTSGGRPEKVSGSMNALTKPGAVAVDGTHVYWLTHDAVLRSKK